MMKMTVGERVVSNDILSRDMDMSPKSNKNTNNIQVPH
jgi:hypothetical protein